RTRPQRSDHQDREVRLAGRGSDHRIRGLGTRCRIRLAARSTLNIQMSTRPVVPLDGGASSPPEVLGHKGYGVDMMRRNGLPVPTAFCITAEVGARYRADPEATINAIWADV